MQVTILKGKEGQITQKVFIDADLHVMKKDYDQFEHEMNELIAKYAI